VLIFFGGQSSATTDEHLIMLNALLLTDLQRTDLQLLIRLVFTNLTNVIHFVHQIYQRVILLLTIKLLRIHVFSVIWTKLGFNIQIWWTSSARF